MRRMLASLTLAAAFGAADQFLGARGYLLGYWATEVSLLSAPWLLIAFLAGWWQPAARRAALAGFACTLAALVAYWAMTLSPVEGASVTLLGVRGLLVSQSAYLGGAVVTGPLFGLLGHRRRTRRDRASALVTAFVVCCEPLAHVLVGTGVGFGGVWRFEVAAGVAMALYAVAATRPQAARRHDG